ncbi:hypothetical protein C0995_007662 [Termitomyces sp. Mi166|nr:hypothetical protein C0995_007662 [Termitomyces sp. Mi166\
MIISIASVLLFSNILVNAAPLPVAAPLPIATLVPNTRKVVGSKSQGSRRRYPLPLAITRRQFDDLGFGGDNFGGGFDDLIEVSTPVLMIPRLTWALTVPPRPTQVLMVPLSPTRPPLTIRRLSILSPSTMVRPQPIIRLIILPLMTRRQPSTPSPMTQLQTILLLISQPPPLMIRPPPPLTFPIPPTMAPPPVLPYNTATSNSGSSANNIVSDVKGVAGTVGKVAGVVGQVAGALGLDGVEKAANQVGNVANGVGSVAGASGNTDSSTNCAAGANTSGTSDVLGKVAGTVSKVANAVGQVAGAIGLDGAKDGADKVGGVSQKVDQVVVLHLLEALPLLLRAKNTAVPSTRNNAVVAAASSTITATISSTAGSCEATGTNDATMTLIKNFEGFVKAPAPDPIGLPTVGFGHKCQSAGCAEVPFSFPLSQDTATRLLQLDAAQFVDCINGAVNDNVALNDNQCQDEHPHQEAQQGEDPNTVATEELPKFNKAGGKVLQCLVNHRAAEVQLFQTPSSVQAHPCN